MELECTGRYRSSAGEWEPGALLQVKDEVGEFLLRDSPSSFRVVTLSTDTPKRAAPAAPAKAKKGANPEVEAEVDVEHASIEELTAFAAVNGIALEAGASEEDVRAAIALELEERAKAKVASAETAGTKANTRPAPKNSRSR